MLNLLKPLIFLRQLVPDALYFTLEFIKPMPFKLPPNTLYIHLVIMHIAKFPDNFIDLRSFQKAQLTVDFPMTHGKREIVRIVVFDPRFLN